MIRNSESKWNRGLYVCCLINRIAIAVISTDGVFEGTAFVHCVVTTDRSVGITAIVPNFVNEARVLAFVTSRHISGTAK